MSEQNPSWVASQKLWRHLRKGDITAEQDTARSLALGEQWKGVQRVSRSIFQAPKQAVG